MSGILGAIKEAKHSQDNILELAKLPQTLIMQMAERGEISKDMVMPILGKKAELAEEAAKMEAAKKIASQGGVQPTVMEQYMGKIAQSEHPILQQQDTQQAPEQAPQQMAQVPEDVGIASQATQPMSLAGGGIIAFGDGGDVGDEEDIAYDMAREDADMNMGSSISDIYKMARHGISNLMSKLPHSYETEKSKVATAQQAMPERKSTGHPLEAKAIAAAQQVGLDPRLMLHALQKESGGLKDPATAHSKAGAYGPMQLMEGTAKQLGVDRKNVDQNIYGGALYLKQMMDKYKDPQLALAAYNAGPGRLDKALRSSIGLSALPRETQNYMKYAQGGEVQHFAGGDYVSFGEEVPYDPSQSWGIKDWWNRMTPGTKEYIADSEANKNKNAESKKPKQTQTVTQPTGNVDLQSVFANHTAQQQVNPERDVFAEMIADNAQRRADLKESAKEDKNLAMLAAGLGMLGGTSQYWSENVGKGAQKGVESFSASKTRRAAEQNALSAADLKALYYGQENKRKQTALAEGMRDKDLDNLTAYDAKLRKQFFMEGVTPTAKQLEAYESAKRGDPLYQSLLKNTGVKPTSAPQGRIIDFSAIGR